ncbi:MAG: cyclic nucleotide-binding domain-containing protein, partial [Aphanizomenon sp.]
MTYIQSTFEDFIASIEGFDQLSKEEINKFLSSEILQPLRYRIGQKIIGKEQLPERIAILYQGNVRLLGYDPQTHLPITLKKLQPGAIIGEIAWLRELPCETAIASTEVVCLSWKAADYLQFLTRNPAFGKARQNQSHLIEIFDVLSSQVAQKALVNHNLKDISEQAQLESKVHYLSPGKTSLKELDSSRIWFVSGRSSLNNFLPGSRLEDEVIEVKGKAPVRLLGINAHDLLLLDGVPTESEILETISDSKVNLEIPYAPDQEFVPPTTSNKSLKNKNYPFVRGQGELEAPLACFQMLSKHLEIPFRKEVVRRILNDQIQRQGSISFQVCAYLSELIGLKSQLVDVPAVSINRIPTPALIRYRDSFAVLYAIDGKTVVLGLPSQGIINCQINQLVEELETDDANLQPQVRVLLLSATKETPKERFGLGW